LATITHLELEATGTGAVALKLKESGMTRMKCMAEHRDRSLNKNVYSRTHSSRCVDHDLCLATA
jgi:hypothetical protein